MLHDRFPDHASEEPVEMVWGEVGDTRKVIELDRLVQVLLDVDKNAENPFLVDLLGLWLHGVVLCAGYSTMTSPTELDRGPFSA
jgi:hypothetical protein